MNSKHFWKMVKPFITNKGSTDHNDIILIEEGKQIRDKKEVAEKLNNFFSLTSFISQLVKQLSHLKKIENTIRGTRLPQSKLTFFQKLRLWWQVMTKWPP